MESGAARQGERERQTRGGWPGGRPLLVLTLAVALIGLGGCGASSPVVIQIGATAVREDTVEHWSRVIAKGQMVGGFRAEARGTPRARALEFLISAEWLRGEASAQGVTPSAHTVDRALEDRRQANGAGEFEQSLHAAGQSSDDVKLELEAELARAAIRQKVLSQLPAVTEAEVADYYGRNRRLFRNPEKREAELIENLPSPAAATALVKRIGIHAAFSKKALHEKLQLNRGAPLEPDIERVTHAIFKTRPGIASRPMRLNGHWTVFVVRRITPASYKSISEVRASIVARLSALHRQEKLAALTKAYRARWSAKTRCQTGYVVEGCAAYTGPLRADAEPFADE